MILNYNNIKILSYIIKYIELYNYWLKTGQNK